MTMVVVQAAGGLAAGTTDASTTSSLSLPANMNFFLHFSYLTMMKNKLLKAFKSGTWARLETRFAVLHSLSNRILGIECDLNKSHLIPKIRYLKPCETANPSRVSSRAQVSVLRRDPDSLSHIVWVNGFHV